MKLFLTVSITPRTNGSTMLAAPLAMMTSRAIATAEAEGCCAYAAEGPKQAQATTTMVARRERKFPCMLNTPVIGLATFLTSRRNGLPLPRPGEVKAARLQLNPSEFVLTSIDLDNPHPFGPCDDGRCYQADEESVLDHARNSRQRRREHLGVLHAPERGTNHVVPAIGDERMALPGNAQERRTRTPGGLNSGLDGPARRRQAERHDLDRQWETTEHRHPFGIVRNHDHAVGC